MTEQVKLTELKTLKEYHDALDYCEVQGLTQEWQRIKKELENKIENAKREAKKVFQSFQGGGNPSSITGGIMINVTQLPHYHVMDSEWGDIVERPIKTWEQAVRELRACRRTYNEQSYTGSATDGAYFLDDIMLSIYTCTGEQPCPCEEEV